MTRYSHSQQSLIFFTGSLFLWQFISVLSPSPWVQFISIGLCGLDLLIFFWLIRCEKVPTLLSSKPYRLLLYFLLGLQFSLSLPIQTSDWIRIPNETFELSSQALTTCLKQSPYRLFYQFSCSLNGKKITIDLPKNAITIEIQPNKIGLEHTQRYTYSLLDVLIGLSRTQQPTQFQQSHFTFFLPSELAEQVSLHEY